MSSLTFKSNVLLLSVLSLGLVACGSPPSEGAATGEEGSAPAEAPSVKRGQGDNPVGAGWDPEGSFLLEDGDLEISAVIGGADCCAGATVEYEGSPLRVFIAPVDEAALEGYVFFLGKGNVPVLMAQLETQGIYDKLVYRAQLPVTRGEDGRVSMSLSSELLPNRDLKVWSGIDGMVRIGGLELPSKRAVPAPPEGDPDRPMPEGENVERDKQSIPVGVPGTKSVKWGETVPAGIPYVLVKRPGGMIPIPAIRKKGPTAPAPAPEGG